MNKIIQTIDERPPGLRLISLREAMKYGRWARNKIYELIAAGKLVAYKDGARTMIDLGSIESYQRSLPRAIAHGRRKKKGK